MPDQALIDILKPAYGPCPNFESKCEPCGTCIFEPANGYVPAGFGGATGSLDEVQLVIVTAEPGAPIDNAGYREGMSAEQMVLNSIRIFHEAMENGGVQRQGRLVYPFHHNMQRILDEFWPGESLDSQLRKTWATNAVLCPIQKSGDNHSKDHPKEVEKICAATYLKKQLALFPRAFVLALGGKAQKRMEEAGLPFCAKGIHPSAGKHVPVAVMIKSWNAAASTFHRSEIRDNIFVPAEMIPTTGMS